MMSRLVPAGLLLALCSLPLLAAPRVDTLDRQQAAALVEASQYRQPTLIALWSLECSYCKQNLAHFRQAQQAYPQLRLITVASEPRLAEHAALLASHGLDGQHYAYADEAPEAMAYALDPRWRGELPRTLLFDGHGGQQALSGVLDMQRITQLLELAD